ncbi:MAG: hypothetical protein ACK4SY_10545, partial [Pyrobaculum sp.]
MYNPQLFRYLPCFNSIRLALSGDGTMEQAAAACGVSPEAVRAYLDGNPEPLEQELRGTAIGPFLEEYARATGRSLLKSLYEAKTIIERTRSGDLGELVRAALLTFGVVVDDVRVIDV